MVCQPTTGGAATCVAQLAHAGVRAGVQVTVACPPGGRLAAWVAEAGASLAPLAMGRTPGPGDAWALARLRRLAAGRHVVHLHSSKAGALGRLALAALPPGRRPACAFTPHGWSWLVGGAMAPLYRGFERWAAPLADRIVAVSAGEAALGREVLGPQEGRLVVVENGVDTERITPDGPSAPRRPEPLVVVAGRLCTAKGQDLAVRALAAMSTPRARLRLVGSGEDGAGLERLARDLGVADRVELVGERDQVAPDLRAADVVLVPSRYEGLSLVLLEAMACGSAVVMAQVPGHHELGGAGVVVPAGDHRAMAAALDRLLADEQARKALGAAARERVVARFPLRRCTEATLELWRSLAA